VTRVILFTALVVALVAGAAHAQAPSVSPQVAATAGTIHVLDGQSLVLNTDFDVTRVAVTKSAVADATVIQPRQLLIDGKAPGSVSLVLWGNDDRMVQYDLVSIAG